MRKAPLYWMLHTKQSKEFYEQSSGTFWRNNEKKRNVWRLFHTAGKTPAGWGRHMFILTGLMVRHQGLGLCLLQIWPDAKASFWRQWGSTEEITHEAVVFEVNWSFKSEYKVVNHVSFCSVWYGECGVKPETGYYNSSCVFLQKNPKNIINCPHAWDSQKTGFSSEN